MAAIRFLEARGTSCPFSGDSLELASRDEKADQEHRTSALGLGLGNALEADGFVQKAQADGKFC